MSYATIQALRFIACSMIAGALLGAAWQARRG